MRKGMGFGALIAIVLGIIVILVILSAFGTPLYKTVRDLFAEKGLLAPKGPGEESVLIPGTKVGEVPVQTQFISNTRDQIKERLVGELNACWQLMRRSSVQNKKCGVFSVHYEGSAEQTRKLTKDEIVAALRARDPTAADTLSSDWGEGANNLLSGKNELGAGAYLICADYDSTGDDLYLTTFLEFDCE